MYKTMYNDNKHYMIYESVSFIIQEVYDDNIYLSLHKRILLF